MHGIKINKKDVLEFLSYDDDLKLLVQTKDIEIMIQKIYKSSSVWIEPANDTNTLEFFYVLDGKIEVKNKESSRELTKNDSFYVTRLQEKVHLVVIEDVTLLYVTNRPLYDEISDFQGKLNNLLKVINNKDSFTYEHCNRVKKYSEKIYDVLSTNFTINYENLIIAAAFHDVGKYLLPDEIVKKEGPLTEKENEIMKSHVINSADIIKNVLSDDVVKIIMNHHERLDGSGYFGKKSDDLNIESNIIIVCDTFDRLVYGRGYEKKYSKSEAVNYLYNQSDKYDPKISVALKYIIDNEK